MGQVLPLVICNNSCKVKVPMQTTYDILPYISIFYSVHLCNLGFFCFRHSFFMLLTLSRSVEVAMKILNESFGSNLGANSGSSPHYTAESHSQKEPTQIHQKSKI